MSSPTDGDRTDVSNDGLKTPVIVILGCLALLVVLAVLAAALS